MEVITQFQNTNKLTIFTKTPILGVGNVEQCRTEVLGIVELEHRQLEKDTAQKELVERRAAFAKAYHSLPEYGSRDFWHRIEEPDVKAALSIEILVKCARVAIAHGDDI